MRTPTSLRIDKAVFFGALVVYFLVWMGCISDGFHRSLLPIAAAIAAVYVGMHVLTGLVRGRCLLEVEPWAFLVAAGAAIFLIPVFAVLGIGNLHEMKERFIYMGPSIPLGHIAALAFCFLADSALKRLFQKKIRAEESLSNRITQN
jgi:hypothetical protein